MGERDERPYGRDQVQAAILEAARRRFTREGTSTSLRDIARDAGVNLGLVHRHFGTKEALIRAVLGEVSSEALAVLAEAETLGGILQATINGAVGHEDALETYVRTLAWVSLSGQDSRDYQKDFPAMALAMGDQSPEHRAQVLLIMAAAFGWEIFSRHLAAMVGYRSERVAGEALKCALKDAGRSVL